MKDLLAKILGSFDYKDVIYKLYVNVIKEKLEAMVKETDNSWDDRAVESLSYLIEKFLGPNS